MGNLLFLKKKNTPSKEEILESLSREEVFVQKCLKASCVTQSNGRSDVLPFDLVLRYKISYELPNEPIAAALLIDESIMEDRADMEIFLKWFDALHRDLSENLKERWKDVNGEGDINA